MTTTTDYPSTAKQQDFIFSLIAERDTAALEAKGSTVEDIKAQVPNLSKRVASLWIERLLELPRKASAPASTDNGDFKALAEKVPAGRYAVTGEDGTTDFYRVDKPEQGRWAGYTFVKLGLGGGHGDPHWQRVSFKNTAAILQKIATDGPEAASKRFGLELGACGVCGRTLTNPDSIERGIGPVCAAKHSWSF